MSTPGVAPGGYAHAGYAHSLREFGTPLALPASGGWLLTRPVPGADATDATGPYPLFTCRDWSALPHDIAGLPAELVSVVLVVDPFAPLTEPGLRKSFDVVRPFKTHFLVDLTRPPGALASRHHRRAAARAARSVEVVAHPDPPAFLEQWTTLYAGLAERKGLTGVRAFSRAAFAEQLRIPGALVLVAQREGRVVGADWYLVDGDRAYGHLAASTAEGYALEASYALQWHALEVLHAAGARVLDLGGVPGQADDARAGLARFKAGWASHTGTAHLAGKVVDRSRYERLRSRTAGGAAWFPAYRAGEGA